MILLLRKPAIAGDRTAISAIPLYESRGWKAGVVSAGRSVELCKVMAARSLISSCRTTAYQAVGGECSEDPLQNAQALLTFKNFTLFCIQIATSLIRMRFVIVLDHPLAGF
mgnify:CR=1 FL=1